MSERASLPGVNQGRAHQILAGALVAEGAMDLLGIESLEICPWALREGIILNHLDHLEYFNGNGVIDDVHGFNAAAKTGDPMDDRSHGTHVCGTVGAVGNNGIGVIGAGRASRGLIRLRNGKIVTVRLGDRIDGGAINSIGNGRISYVKGGRQFNLPILNGR